MSFAVIDNLEVDLLDRWFRMDEPTSPVSLACEAGCDGCIQLSVARYQAGERPWFSVEILEAMLENMSRSAGPYQLVEKRGYRAGAHLIFERQDLLEDIFLMNALKEQGPDLIHLTYTQMRPCDPRQGVHDARLMLQTIRLNPKPHRSGEG